MGASEVISMSKYFCSARFSSIFLQSFFDAVLVGMYSFSISSFNVFSLPSQWAISIFLWCTLISIELCMRTSILAILCAFMHGVLLIILICSHVIVSTLFSYKFVLFDAFLIRSCMIFALSSFLAHLLYFVAYIWCFCDCSCWLSESKCRFSDMANTFSPQLILTVLETHTGAWLQNLSYPTLRSCVDTDCHLLAYLAYLLVVPYARMLLCYCQWFDQPRQFMAPSPQVTLKLSFKQPFQRTCPHVTCHSAEFPWLNTPRYTSFVCKL